MNVYVIGPEGGPYKIGIAASVRDRLAALQTGNPERLKAHFTHYVEAALARDVEQAAHSVLSDWRLTGEWFAVPLASCIGAIRQGVLIAPHLAEAATARGRPDRSARPREHLVLQALSAASQPEDMNLPGMGFRVDPGADAPRYSVRLDRDGRRMSFAWKGGAADVRVLA